MNASLLPVSSEPVAVCANCGAALVADQRYCLTCGHPVSPVRLAFLDVLQDGSARTGAPEWAAPATIELGPAGYAPPLAPTGAAGWLRRYSGLLTLLSVLLLCLIAGLLVGHWATQKSAASGPQVVKVEGLSGLGGAAAGASTSESSTAGAASHSTPAGKVKQEATEAKEGEKETKAEKAPPPAPVKVNSTKLDKLSKSTGKKHHEEIEALGAQPIETG
jgi:hypothetical protein